MVVVCWSNNHQISSVNSKTNGIFEAEHRKVFLAWTPTIGLQLRLLWLWSLSVGVVRSKWPDREIVRWIAIRIETSANIGAGTLECGQLVLDTPKSSKKFPETSGSGNTWSDRQRKSDGIGQNRPQ